MPPALIAAGIGAAGVIGGALISSSASSKAADATAQGAATATAEQRRQFDINQANQQPWLERGGQGLDALAKVYGLDSGTPDFSGFFASPDYNYRKQQSLDSLTAQQAKLGLLDSGSTGKGYLQRVGDLASGEFGTYANRMANLAGVGQTTATNLASQGQNYANQVGNIAINAADNRASAYNAQGNNYASAVRGLAGLGQQAYTEYNAANAPLNVNTSSLPNDANVINSNFRLPSVSYSSAWGA